MAFDKNTREPYILSFKSTSAGAARAINTFLSLRKGPAFATTFKISSALKPFEEASAYVFTVQPGGPVDKETYEFASQLYTDLAGRAVSDEGIEGDHADGAAKDDKDVPF